MTTAPSIIKIMTTASSVAIQVVLGLQGSPQIKTATELAMGGKGRRQSAPFSPSPGRACQVYAAFTFMSQLTDDIIFESMVYTGSPGAP